MWVEKSQPIKEDSTGKKRERKKKEQVAPIEAELMEKTDKHYNQKKKKNVMRTLKGMQLGHRKIKFWKKKALFLNLKIQ